MAARRELPWLAAAGFWVFVSVMYAAQLWWLSRLPGERIDLRAAITWQTTYFLLWIPFTLLVWRVTAAWLPDSGVGWPRLFLRHVPLFAGVAAVHFIAVAAASTLFGVSRGTFWGGVGMQVRGRLHLELLVY